MSEVHRSRDIDQESKCPSSIERSSFERLRERPSAQEIHDQERPVLLLAGSTESDDALVVPEELEDSRLAPEPFSDAGGRILEKLEREPFRPACGANLEDGTHAPAPEKGDDLVAGDSLHTRTF
jgi:hypothetical protein